MLWPDMENSESVHAPTVVGAPQKRDQSKLGILVAILFSFGVIGSAYITGPVKIASGTRQNNELKAKVLSLNEQIKQQNNLNQGITLANNEYKDSAGKLGLVDGAITFELPKDWARVPTTSCSGGSRDSEVLCYDVAAIAPKSLINEGQSNWSAEVAVFEYKSTEGSAQNWYEARYDGMPLASYNVPSALNLKTDVINGDSSVSFQLVGEIYKGVTAYTNAFYVVVHGKYAVLVHARLQDGGVYGSYPGAKPYDYRTIYEPILRHFIESIKFKE